MCSGSTSCRGAGPTDRCTAKLWKSSPPAVATGNWLFKLNGMECAVESNSGLQPQSSDYLDVFQRSRSAHLLSLNGLTQLPHLTASHTCRSSCSLNGLTQLPHLTDSPLAGPAAPPQGATPTPRCAPSPHLTAPPDGPTHLQVQLLRRQARRPLLGAPSVDQQPLQLSRLCGRRFERVQARPQRRERVRLRLSKVWAVWMVWGAEASIAGGQVCAMWVEAPTGASAWPRHRLTTSAHRAACGQAKPSHTLSLTRRPVPADTVYLLEARQPMGSPSRPKEMREFRKKTTAQTEGVSRTALDKTDRRRYM
eukprot:356278-Chlamydomonas_euryale.AAC.1